MSLAPGLELTPLTTFELPGAKIGQGMRLAGFVVDKQDLGSWCWAAVAVAITRFYTGNTTDQCVLVTRILPLPAANPQATCCPAELHKGDKNCDRTFNTDAALLTHLAPPPAGGPIPFSEIQNQIQGPSPETGHPIACTLQGGNEIAGAHAMAISGWAEVPLKAAAGPVRFVYYHDPITKGEEGWTLYSDFVQDGDVNWVETYLTR